MKKVEEISANKLRAFLEKKGHIASFEDGYDPPDIHFYVDDKKWAVEHTQLHQYADFNGKEISRKGVDSTIFSFEKYINQKLLDVLRNRWVLAIKGPISKIELKTIENEVLKIIKNDRSEDLFRYSNNLYSLEKTMDNHPELALYSILNPVSKIPNSSKLTADIQEQVNYAIDRILKYKRPKFKKMLNYDKRILLLENQYMFTTVEKVKNRFSFYPDLYKEIDSVYLISYEDVYSIY